MGANEFEQYEPGADVVTAFYRAREAAVAEYGNGGYSGSLAEKDGFIVVATAPLPARDAERLARQLMEDEDERVDDKWGPAGAVPVAGEDGSTKGWLFFGWSSS